MAKSKPEEQNRIMADHYKRSSDRIGSPIACVTVYGVADQPVPAALLDESLGGIGIALSSDVHLGTTLEVEVSGTRRWAIVRGVQPLPSGCRIGLEWKAQALARHFRSLNQIVSKSQANDSELAHFTKILPGGLCTMWRLFEAKNWAHMAESTDRLRKAAAQCGIRSISASAERLQDALRHAAAAGSQRGEPCLTTIKQAFDSLTQKCIQTANERLSSTVECKSEMVA